MRLRSFLAGLIGGAVAAVLVVLVLVLVLGLGTVEKTVVREVPAGPVATVAPGPGATLTPQEIYRRLSPGVVMILARFDGGIGPFGVPGSSESLGTGFVVDGEGYILTNAHVVDQQGLRAKDVTVVFNKGGAETQRVQGKLVGVDVSSDVAVIKVDPDEAELHPLPLGDSDKVVVGEPVVAIGNPLGFDFSITAGIVSAVGRSLEAPNGRIIPNGIQTDAAINQGNSGGPLINGRGEVIGINEQIASQSGGNEGLGFAVPINTAKRSLEQLREKGRVEYAWMGVSLATLSSDLADLFNIDAPAGAIVQEVVPGSPADKAGIRGGTRTVTVQGQTYVLGGDVIVAADGKPIRSADELIAFIAAREPGDTVTVTILRENRRRDVKVKLAARPANL